MPPKCLEIIVILCLERCFSKQNSVIRRNNQTIWSPKIFVLATPLIWAVFPQKNVHEANVCFSAHAVPQPCKHIGSKVFQALQRLCGIYTILKHDCCQCTRMTFHYTSVLLALRICAAQSRAVNGPHFEARNRKPESGPSPSFIFEAQFRPEVKFPE